MSNIDRFDEYAAVVLARLYERFPVKTMLDVRSITGHTGADEFGAVCGPDGRPSREAEIAWATIEWLADTGYVRVSKATPPVVFVGCVLTAEGLKLLKAVPGSVRAGETGGERIVRLLGEGAVDLAKDIVRGLLALG